MDLKICISGLTATGKTTLAVPIAERYNAEYVSASANLIRLARAKKQLVVTEEDLKHFWLREKGLQLFEQREKRKALDEEVDRSMLSYLGVKGNHVLDSLTLPSLMPRENNAFTILLEASLSQRVERAWRSSPTLTKDALRKGIKEKDGRTRDLLQSLWGIDIIGPQIERYDLIIDDGKVGLIFGKKASPLSMIHGNLKILYAFLDVYQCLMGISSGRSVEIMVQKCQRVCRRYGPIIKKFPREFVSVPMVKSLSWEERHL